jgi:hypothetical protein
MTGEERYHQAIQKSRLLGHRDMQAFLGDKLDVLPCQMDRDRDCLIEAFDELLAELDRCKAILRAAGLDGARGEAMRPQRQRGDRWYQGQQLDMQDVWGIF